jgi:4-hydroxy-3-polyprenylbenzoate decarboxylase
LSIIGLSPLTAIARFMASNICLEPTDMPCQYPPISLPPREHLEKAAARWADYGLPPLDEINLPKGL